MTDSDGDHAHAARTCALYLLGALDAAAEAVFEKHLARCGACQDECDRLGPIVSGLGQLDAAALRAADPREGRADPRESWADPREGRADPRESWADPREGRAVDPPGASGVPPAGPSD